MWNGKIIANKFDCQVAENKISLQYIVAATYALPWASLPYCKPSTAVGWSIFFTTCHWTGLGSDLEEPESSELSNFEMELPFLSPILWLHPWGYANKETAKIIADNTKAEILLISITTQRYGSFLIVVCFKKIFNSH